MAKKCSCHKRHSKKKHSRKRRSKGMGLGEMALWGIGAITLGKII